MVLVGRITKFAAPSSWRCWNYIQITYVSSKPVRRVKFRSEKQISRAFVDVKQVRVFGGNGGDGCVSFLSLYANEFAGPDGGDGGNGAHVIFQATPNKTSLRGISSILQGDSGENGRNKDCTGKSAKHAYINVPLGTLVRNEEGHLLADLAYSGDMFVGARGGAGGKGNAFFASSENTAPRQYEVGGKGEERLLVLELSIIAHAGLIGFPNAGKSSLLRCISRARPKVAAYPFTTLKPHVGMVPYEDYEQIAVADIPGLIRDAHRNRGLGIDFLRHIDRCRFLVYVLDLDVSEPWKQYTDLKFELEQYRSRLLHKPSIVVANKLDLYLSPSRLEQLKERLDVPIIAVSARTGDNIENLLLKLRELYDKYTRKISDNKIK